MLKAATRHELDLVAAWSVDRLGRSLQHLVGFRDELHSRRIDLYLHQQGINTGTPAGKALFQMCGVFAEFERAMTQERVRAGLARARASGKQVSPAIEQQIRGLRAARHHPYRSDAACRRWHCAACDLAVTEVELSRTQQRSGEGKSGWWFVNSLSNFAMKHE